MTMIQKKKKILLKIKKTTIFKTRKVSFYESPKKTVFGTLDFEIPEKNELLENKDDELIIIKTLNQSCRKFKRVNKCFLNSNKVNLCNDFENYFNKDKFIDFIRGLPLMKK